MKKIFYKVFLFVLLLSVSSFVKERYVYFKYYSNVHTSYFLSNFSKPEEAEYQYVLNSKICDSKNIHKDLLFQTIQYHESKSKCLSDLLSNIN
jgi:hypothetical protein